jgi:ABC-2 type transport system permease protein
MSRNWHHPLWQLVINRIRLFYRQPEAVFWTYGFPLVIVTALGLAFRSDQSTILHVDVIGPQAVAVEAKLAHDPRFKLARPAETDWKKRLQTGKTNLVVETGESADAPPQLWDEPRRPESLLAREAVENALLRSQLPEAPKFPTSQLNQIGNRYIDFLLPGMIGMNLMGGGMWGIGFVIVDMRVRKLLKRLLATPMRRYDFLFSVMIVRLLFAVFDMAFLLTFGYFAFGVQCSGNLLELAIVMLVGGASFAGIGLLVASRAQTIDAISGLMNLIMLPMWITSGVFFTSERFPEFIQPVIQALPLTCLNNALRGVMLNGESLLTLWSPLLILALWGSCSFALALRIFRWK